MDDMSLTEAEIEYLGSQRLGRLASISPIGMPQNSPVGFRYNPETGTIDIGGHNLTSSRKFRNVQVEPRVSFVVDDLASTRPWRVRGVEIRGSAEALAGPEPLIRIRPTRIISWGIPEDARLTGRDVDQ
jgi:pyridoxamine 5'-phosphate oxidase family protein